MKKVDREPSGSGGAGKEGAAPSPPRLGAPRPAVRLQPLRRPHPPTKLWCENAWQTLIRSAEVKGTAVIVVVVPRTGGDFCGHLSAPRGLRPGRASPRHSCGGSRPPLPAVRSRLPSHRDRDSGGKETHEVAGRDATPYNRNAASSLRLSRGLGGSACQASSPPLTPTLVFPVMLKRKLKVRRREEAAQVPELRSSWLQLRREKEEVKWSSHRDGGGGAMTRGETGDASAKTREREREGEGGLGGQGAPTTHLLGLPGCGHWVPRPHYLCRELQAPPRWMQTTPSY